MRGTASFPGDSLKVYRLQPSPRGHSSRPFPDSGNGCFLSPFRPQLGNGSSPNPSEPSLSSGAVTLSSPNCLSHLSEWFPQG